MDPFNHVVNYSLPWFLHQGFNIVHEVGTCQSVDLSNIFWALFIEASAVHCYSGMHVCA